MINRCLVILLLTCLMDCRPEQAKLDPLTNTLFKFGFKSGSSSTGPLMNSGFIFRSEIESPPLFLTAHHCVSNKATAGAYYAWDEISKTFSNGWAWSMSDLNHQIPMGKNLPLRNAKTLGLDVAAFFIPDDGNSYLLPSATPALVGDTVKLFSRLIHNGDTTLINPAIVTYASDSVLVYKLLNIHHAQNVMAGTSGSPVLNKQNQVISNSYGGFMYSGEQDKAQIQNIFPLLSQMTTAPDSVYGIGVPSRLINRAILAALHEDQK